MKLAHNKKVHSLTILDWPFGFVTSILSILNSIITLRVCYTFTEPIWMVFSLEIDWTLMKYISYFLLRYEETDRYTSEFIILTWTNTDSMNDGENKRNGLLNTVREHWHSWICVIQFCWQNQEEGVWILETSVT